MCLQIYIHTYTYIYLYIQIQVVRGSVSREQVTHEKTVSGSDGSEHEAWVCVGRGGDHSVIFDMSQSHEGDT